MSLLSENELCAARFATSAASLDQCPTSSGEVVFLGRSNAGKSSSINAICAQANLARTSRTPGRTQLLNYFSLADGKYLVDAPGFGYARVSKQQQRDWSLQLQQYLSQRQELLGVVLVSDMRQAPAEFDRNCINWAQQSGLPCLWLLNKSDKLKQGERIRKLRQLHADYPKLMLVTFSALRRQGLELARQHLLTLLAQPAN